MSYMPPAANESAPDTMGPMPPDASPMTVRDHLQAAAQLIAQDRSLDDEEMAAISEFVAVVQQVAQASQQAQAGGQPGQPGMGGGGPMGYAQSLAGQTNAQAGPRNVQPRPPGGF